MNVNKFLCLAD